MTWFVPAALTAAVLGGLAYLRKDTLTAKPGDFVAVNPAVLTPAALAATAVAPGGTPVLPSDARLLVLVQQAGPAGVAGQIVGYSSASSPKQAVLLFGGAGGIPSGTIPPSAIQGIYRGSPPTLVA